MGCVALFKSQEDFYRRNKATMKTARELTNEAERGAVDLRYAYKILPPGSRNFLAKAWSQTWGDDSLMNRAAQLDSKRPVIEKFNMDTPETGSLPTRAHMPGLGGNLICDTIVGDSADYLRIDLFSKALKAGGNDSDEDNLSSHDGESVASDEDGKETLKASDIASGDVGHGSAGWGPAPSDNSSAIRSSRGGSRGGRSRGSARSSAAETEHGPISPAAAARRGQPTASNPGAAQTPKPDEAEMLRQKYRLRAATHGVISRYVSGQEPTEEDIAHINQLGPSSAKKFKQLISRHKYTAL